jgi:hypothetical protein
MCEVVLRHIIAADSWQALWTALSMCFFCRMLMMSVFLTRMDALRLS